MKQIPFQVAVSVEFYGGCTSTTTWIGRQAERKCACQFTWQPAFCEKAKFFVDTNSVQCYTNHVTRSLPFFEKQATGLFFCLLRKRQGADLMTT